MRMLAILAALFLMAGCAQKPPKANEGATTQQSPSVNCFWMGRLWICD